MSKNNPRQGMGELLASQRTGPPLTPAEAARQRRSGQRGSAADAAGSEPQEEQPVVATQPADSLAPDEANPAEGGPAIRDQPGEVAVAGASQAGPGPARRAFDRAASYKIPLLAASGAVAISVLWWLTAGRRRRARALSARSVWPARRA
jgi:hypothetical protein